jgi:glyoxylase I family protein
MIELQRIAHFSIPVTDLERSARFYEEVVGCKILTKDKKHCFMDAGGTCLLLCKQKGPITQQGQEDLVHHAFAISSAQYKTIGDHLKQHQVAVLYSEDRSGGTVNGPRTYFRDPDGTRLEFIDLTSYDATPRLADI